MPAVEYVAMDRTLHSRVGDSEKRILLAPAQVPFLTDSDDALDGLAAVSTPVPEAVVDETAPLVDLGGTDRDRYGHYLGPKIPANWNKPHPKSYGAKAYPLRSSGRFQRARTAADALHHFHGSPALFSTGRMLCETCKGSGLVSEYETTTYKTLRWLRSSTCETCSGTGRQSNA